MAMKSLQRDMEELKESINMMSSDITNLMKQNTTITWLLTEIKLLKTKNMEQEKKIAFLENRVSDLEQYSRMNDVVVSGLQTKPRSYARAVSTEKPPCLTKIPSSNK
ncbi:hypothetical protein DPX16_5388 [Xyrichtys novacula]|uniref:Uncharacterized protein n=1 Tax=Xyrichtys novacula TaxID=13765 RepID=A0AAV1G2N3_XYRNO|nr:hypothetical protein DPX16_5388 [Xyrichtys novacula]